MPKFYIHVFRKERIKFEVEAESRDAAAKLVDGVIFGHVGKEVEREGLDDYEVEYLVDPINEDGSVDYENAKWYPEEI